MESNLDELFKTDPKCENEGVNFVFRESDPERGIEEISFKVRRFSETNPRVKQAMTVHFKPYARLIEMGTFPPEKEQEITIKVFVEVCLVSWVGVKDRNGKDLECTKENAFQIFKRLPDLFNKLWKFATSFESFKESLGN